ncbi:MAG: hypothetical protein DUW69_002619 [Verrucomicrobia bacterium]|nr:MAG: hypothetical protein DUW69_002619 [Verrucomicrobiota bacterium]
MTALSSADRDFLAAEGCRIAATLGDRSSAIIIGENFTVAALVAVAIARDEAGRRHVALGDLVGDLAPLYAIAGGEDAIGLSECFREGLPLNDIARPAPDMAALFILPSGAPPITTEEIYANERWPRLIGGFRQAGALMLLVARADAPGIDALVAAADGVIVAGGRDELIARFPILERVGPLPLPERSAVPRDSTPQRRLAVSLGLALIAGALAAGWFYRDDLAARFRGPVAVAAPPHLAPAPPGPTIPVRTDTVALVEPSTPADANLTAYFAVEVVAANTLPGANSVLRENAESAPLPAVTIAPVQLGGGSLWYKVVVGAWHDRAGAETLLVEWREKGIVQRNAGAVVRVPYALLLGDAVPQAQIAAEIDTWRGRGITAYALLQDDGSVRLFAGAFETAAQAAPLAASVRDAGVGAVLAFRTGRTF